MNGEDKNKLFTAARDRLKIAMMFADSIAASPVNSPSDIQRFVNAVSRANDAAIKFKNVADATH